LNIYNSTRKRTSGRSVFAAIALIAIVMAGMVVWSPRTTAFAASTPNMAVDPPYIAANDVFSINITLSGIVDTMKLAGFEFKLRFDPAQLEVVEVKNGTFLEAFAGSPNGGMLYYRPPLGADYVLLGGLILPDKEGIWHGAFPSGSGTIASIDFKVISAPPAGSTGCNLTLFNTKLSDILANAIAHTVTNGRYEFIRPNMSVDPPFYDATAVDETFSVDIKIINLSAAAKVVGFEFKLRYNTTLLEVVEVKNGTFFEAFGGMLYYRPPLGADYVLLGGLILPDVNGKWNGPFPSGSGTIATIVFKVKPQPVGSACDLILFNTKLGDPQANAITHFTANGYYSMVLPTLRGDLNGDGKVDIFDALILAMAFGTSPGQPNWNSVADIKQDDTIDILDAIILSNNFGKTA